MKKTLNTTGFVLMILLLPGFMTGCGGKHPATESTTILTVEVFDRNFPGYLADNNFQTKWIREQVKKEPGFDIKFIIVPRMQEIDKLNILMAAGQAPDICFTYKDEVIYNYLKNEGLTDLSEILDKYGPNLKKYLGEDLLSYGRWGSRQFAIPAKRVLKATFTSFIRKDWLDKLHLPVPQSLKEFYDTMKAFKTEDPGNTGGKVIPFGVMADPNNINWTTSILLESFKMPVTDEDRQCLNNWVTPGYKEGIRFLNKMYHEGLISPQFYLDKDGKIYEKDFVQGRMGAIIQGYDFPYRSNPGWTNELEKNVPGAKLIPFDPFVNSEGKHIKMKYNPNGLYIIVPRFSKNAIAAIQYLDWMCDPQVLFFLQNGIKGEQYLDEQNGIPIRFIPNDQLPDEKKYNFIDLPIIVNGREFGSEEKNMEAASLGYPGYEDYFKMAYTIAMNDAQYMPHFDILIESQSKYGQTLLQKEGEIFVKSITADPDGFDKVYDKLVSEYMAYGGQQVIEEKRAAYRKMHSR